MCGALTAGTDGAAPPTRLAILRGCSNRTGNEGGHGPGETDGTTREWAVAGQVRCISASIQLLVLCVHVRPQDSRRTTQ